MAEGKKMRIDKGVYDDLKLLGGVLGTKSASDTIDVLLTHANLTRDNFIAGNFDALGIFQFGREEDEKRSK